MLKCGKYSIPYILFSGNSTLSKFRINKLCFQVKCASEFEYGTQAPPSETTCKIVDGEQVCESNLFSAVGGIVSMFSVVLVI